MKHRVLTWDSRASVTAVGLQQTVRSKATAMKTQCSHQQPCARTTIGFTNRNSHSSAPTAAGRRNKMSHCCWTQSLLCRLLACLCPTLLLQNCDGYIILCRRPIRLSVLLVLGEKLPHEIASSQVVPDYNDRAKIEVESDIILPFTSDVAFDAFADLRRQPSFSKWLKSVDYIDGSTTNRVGSRSKWTIAISGMRFSWKAESKQLDRQRGIIEWGSVTGLRNEGKVHFATLDGSSTQMRLSMRIYVPKFAVRLMGSNSGEKLAKMIEKRMLRPTLETFRELVAREMVVKTEEEQTIELTHDNNDYSDRQKNATIEEHAEDLVLTSTGFQPVVPQD